jgi:hypothetical protein
MMGRREREREREREKRSERCEKERAKREQKNKLFSYRNCQLTLGALGTLTTLRASPASWTCVEKMGWREREREKRSERCERERAKREQEKQLFSYRNCQLTLGALGTLTTLRASPASWTCVERWGGGRDREREREREREKRSERCERERAKREQEKQTLLLSKLPTHLGSLDDLEGLAGLVGFASLDVDLC